LPGEAISDQSPDFPLVLDERAVVLRNLLDG